MIDANDRRSDWTSEDLDRLRALEAEGLSIAAIADRLGRLVGDVQDRLTLIHAGSNLPSYGPDEEGDVPIPRGARIADPAAWVHVDPERKDVAD
jgi:hypothetical protein